MRKVENMRFVSAVLWDDTVMSVLMIFFHHVVVVIGKGSSDEGWNLPALDFDGLVSEQSSSRWI